MRYNNNYYYSAKVVSIVSLMPVPCSGKNLISKDGYIIHRKKGNLKN